MPLTPEDIANKVFAKKRRGFATDEVDAFLDQIEHELRRLLTENARLASTRGVPRAGGAPVEKAATPAPVGEEPQGAALRTLLMAQRTADEVVGEARAEADKALSDAREEADKAVSDARAEADTLLKAAQERSSRIAHDTDERASTTLAELEASRQDLEAHIDDLRAFEQEYRIRLKGYIESQLRDLDTGGGGADDAGNGVPAAARAAAVGVMPSGVVDSGAARPAALEDEHEHLHDERDADERDEHEEPVAPAAQAEPRWSSREWAQVQGSPFADLNLPSVEPAERFAPSTAQLSRETPGDEPRAT